MPFSDLCRLLGTGPNKKFFVCHLCYVDTVSGHSISISRLPLKPFANDVCTHCTYIYVLYVFAIFQQAGLVQHKGDLNWGL